MQIFVLLWSDYLSLRCLNTYFLYIIFNDVHERIHGTLMCKSGYILIYISCTQWVFTCTLRAHSGWSRVSLQLWDVAAGRMNRLSVCLLVHVCLLPSFLHLSVSSSHSLSLVNSSPRFSFLSGPRSWPFNKLLTSWPRLARADRG